MISIQGVICPWLAWKKCIKCRHSCSEAWTGVDKSNKFKKKKDYKKQEVVNRWKADTIAKKRRKERGRCSLSIEDNRYNDSEISGTDPDQEDSLSNLENN